MATNLPTNPSPSLPQSQPSPQRTLRIATRSSALALTQTSLFTTLLSSHPSPTISSTPTTIHPVHTSLGDTNKTTDLHTLASSIAVTASAPASSGDTTSSSKSLWTSDLEHDLASNKVDIIVHSLKDVPTKLPNGMKCCAVGVREEARDCVVFNPRWTASTATASLAHLPPGSVIGTSSIRRQALIRRAYPTLVIKDMRGNVPTRIEKLDDERLGFDAIVLAGAGVLRLGLGGRVGEWLGRAGGNIDDDGSREREGGDGDDIGGGWWLHAVGQGAIGVEWREGDEWVEGLVKGLVEGLGRRGRRVAWEAAAERELLRVLEGGCSVPVGVDCVWGEEEEDEQVETKHQTETSKSSEPIHHPTKPHHHAGTLKMRATVISVNGQHSIHATKSHPVSTDTEAEELGWTLAQELVEKGAGEILKEISLNRGKIWAQGGA